MKPQNSAIPFTPQNPDMPEAVASNPEISDEMAPSFIAEFVASRQAVIDYLTELGYPALPVAPFQDPTQDRNVIGLCQVKKETGFKSCPFARESTNPIAAFTGKNPSYLDASGKPHLVDHTAYQNRLPSQSEISLWFSNPANGVGTLGGWGNTYWIDIDSKHFETQEECDRAFRSLVEKGNLQKTWIEKTQSSGYRIAVKLDNPPGFTNFCLEPGGSHIGEVLGAGRFTVLAPTIGPTGVAYQLLNLAAPLPVDSMESIGIYPTGKRSSNQEDRKIDFLPRQKLPNAISLEELGTDASRDVLNGSDIAGDRSESLTKAIREWYGWQNWAQSNGISINGSPEELALYAAEKMGIDSDRLERILRTIDPSDCKPAALFKGDETSCWMKIRRIDKSSYEANCPDFIKQVIGDKNGSFQFINAKDGELQANKWDCLKSHNFEIGEWKSDEIKVEEGEPVPPWFSSPNVIAKFKGKKRDDREKKVYNLYDIEIFVPLSNFDFHVERVLSSIDGGGLILRVERLSGGVLATSRVHIASVSTTRINDFVDALKKGLGSNVSCLFDTPALQKLLHVRTEEYRQKGGQTYKLVDRIGMQPDGTWVFPNIQFTSKGQITSEEQTKWVFHANLGQDEFIPIPPIIEPCPSALPNLISAMRDFFGENFLATLVTLGWVSASIHFPVILKEESGFPLLNSIGDAGTNKTLSMEAALSVIWGISGQGVISGASESALYEGLKLLSGLARCLDDPERSNSTEELLKRLYNAKSRIVRGNTQEPHSTMGVASNHAFGDQSPATLSRLIHLHFTTNRQGNKEAYPALREAMKNAPGAFASLIKLGYDRASVSAIEKRLISYLPYANARSAKSLALVLHYTQQVAKLAGIDDDVESYIINTLCPFANDADTTNSLEDFIDKLCALQAEGFIGDWNFRKILNRDGSVKSLAVVLSSVWSILDQRFKPIYSQTILRQQIRQAGGNDRSTQKFTISKQAQLDHDRALLSSNPPTVEPEKVSRKCVEIPIDVVMSSFHKWERPDEPANPVTSVTMSYHAPGNSSDPYLESVSPPSSSSVTLVTKKIDIGIEKKERSTPPPSSGLDGDRARHVSQNLVTGVTDVQNAAETQAEQGLQELPPDGNPMVTHSECGNSDGDWGDYDDCESVGSVAENKPSPSIQLITTSFDPSDLYRYKSQPELWRITEDLFGGNVRIERVDGDGFRSSAFKDLVLAVDLKAMKIKQQWLSGAKHGTNGIKNSDDPYGF